MRTMKAMLLTLLALISSKLFAQEPILTITHQGQTVSATYQELLARSDLTKSHSLSLPIKAFQ